MKQINNTIKVNCETKICKICNKEQPITEFSPAKRTKDRLESRCKTCLNIKKQNI